MLQVGTCRHISAHVDMSTYADTYDNRMQVEMVCIRDAESDTKYGHMSACSQVLTQSSMQTRSKWGVSEVPRGDANVTCWHVSAHVGTYQHMAAPLMEIMSK